MRIPYLTEFIQDCRFSRQEEDYYTAEITPVKPHGQLVYVRPLCVGQQLNLKVFSPALFTLQIHMDCDVDHLAREHPRRSSGVGSLSVEFRVKRSGWYLISLANEAVRPADVAVVIEAPKRSLSVRTGIEKIFSKGFERRLTSGTVKARL
jgi:hypothetical protein